MKRLATLISLFTVGVVLMVAWFMLPAGLAQAPNVELTLVNGGKTDFESFRRGRPVLVTFWATDCASCREEVPNLISLHEYYQPLGFEILAVAMSHDPPNRVWDFMQRSRIPYPVALDLDRSVATAFDNVRVTPTLFLIDADGVVQFQNEGAVDKRSLANRIDQLLANSSPI